MAVLVRRLREIMGKLDGRAQAVLADDGSKDSGYRLTLNARAMDPRSWRSGFPVVSSASTAGLDGAPGQAVMAGGFRRLVAPSQRRPLLPRQ